MVGAHLPIAAGLALGDQYQENDGVTICMFGDGATNIGYFHEALNLSKVWNLPVLWVCENNQYGMGTSVERASAVPNIRQKAEGYNIPNSMVDGMDVMAVKRDDRKDPGVNPGRRRPVLPGSRHLSLPRPLDGRPRALSQIGGDQAVAGKRPDRHLPPLS